MLGFACSIVVQSRFIGFELECESGGVAEADIG